MPNRRFFLAVVLGAILPCLAVAIYLQYENNVTRPALSHSVGTVLGDYLGSCKHDVGAHWRCTLLCGDGSCGGQIYEVIAKGRCWTAVLVDTVGMIGQPPRGSGCIDLLDRLGIFDGSPFVGKAGKGYY